MSPTNFPDLIRQHNQKNLQKLSWGISASQGQFKLIIVRCNYEKLQNLMLQSLQETLSELHIFQLEPTDAALYTLLRHQLGDNKPQGVCVLGLETVRNLPSLLSSLNQIREELRQNLHFPLVVWVTDEGLSQLKEKATDLESWATKVQFELPPDILRNSLQQGANQLFETALSSDFDRVTSILNEVQDMGQLTRSEVDSALHDLKQSGHPLGCTLEANLEFARGLIALEDSDLDGLQNHQLALEHFSESLTFWQNEYAQDHSAETVADRKSRFSSSSSIQNDSLDLHALRTALLHFYVGRCHYHIGNDLNPKEETLAAHQALNQAIHIFEAQNRLDLVNYCLPQQGRVIRRIAFDGLEDRDKESAWRELESIANRGIELHKQHPYAWGFVQYQGFKIDVALHRSNYWVAKRHAEAALSALDDLPEEEKWVESLFLLLLAKSEQKLGNSDTAIKILENAKDLGVQKYPKIHIRVLNALQEIYFAQGEAVPDNSVYFLEAFRTKLNRLSIEQQYGLRAFIGAGRLQPEQGLNPKEYAGNYSKDIGKVATEMQVSRRREIEDLMQRIREREYKLIILHGLSGVGKSSLIDAALIPTLKAQPSGIQEHLPILVRRYDNWAKNLARQLFSALQKKGIAPVPSLELELERNTTQILNTRQNKIPSESLIRAILEQLQALNFDNEQYHLQTILIFDQFEEIFVVSDLAAEQYLIRKQFFIFIGECLELLYTKIILSLREDYLHFLLEGSRLVSESTNFGGEKVLSRNILSDILGDKKLYFVGNFSKSYAAEIIRCLTGRTGSQLPDDLVNVLVDDLSADIGEVRPIELQIVGSVLQERNINSLETYQDLGDKPKEVLVDDFLNQVIRDCGPPNEDTAKIILYLLTGDKEIRPRKTFHELSQDPNAKSFEVRQIKLALDILVESRLVLLFPESPEDRYQLVHDYLANIIRQKIDPNLMEIGRKEKEIVSLREAQKKLLKVGLCLLSLLSILSASTALLAFKQSRLFLKKSFESVIGQTDSLMRSGDQLLALHTISAQNSAQGKVGRSNIFLSEKDIFPASFQHLNILQNNQEVSSFVAHPTAINQITFLKRDGNQLIATASSDETIRVWGGSDNIASTFPGHTARVNSVAFGSKCNILASASDDGQVIIWDLVFGEPKEKLPELDSVTETLSLRGVGKVQISPDGQWMVSGDADGNVKFWEIRCSPIETNNPTSTSDPLDGAYISSDRQKEFEVNIVPIASREQGRVRDIKFHPTENIVAVSSFNNQIKLWDVEGNLVDELSGCDFRDQGFDNNSICRGGEFSYLSFNEDGSILATGGTTNRVYLWTSIDNKNYLRYPYPLEQNGRVVGLSFSRQADGDLLAVGLSDHISLWRVDQNLPRSVSTEALSGVPPVPIQSIDVLSISSVAFSPDGYLWAGLNNGTLKTWDVSARLDQKAYSLDDVAFREFSINPDGTHLATLSASSSPRVPEQNTLSFLAVWDIKNLAEPVPLYETQVSNQARDIQIHPTQSLVAYVSPIEIPSNSKLANRVYCWNLEVPAEEVTPCVDIDFENVSGISFSPDGRYLAIAETLTTPICEAEPREENISPKDRTELIAVDSQTSNSTAPRTGIAVVGTIHLKDLNLSEEVTEKIQIKNPCILGEDLDLESSIISRIKFSPNLKYLAASLGTKVLLYDLEEDGFVGDGRFQISHIEQVNDIAFNQKSDTLVSVGDDKIARAWKIEEGFWSQFINLKGSHSHNPLSYVGKNPRIFATRLIFGKTASHPKSFLGHEANIKRVAFGVHDDTFLSIDTDGTFRLWNIEDSFQPAKTKLTIPGFYLEEFNNPTTAIESIDYNGIRQLIAFIGKNNSLYIWDLSQEDLKMKSCQWLTTQSIHLSGAKVSPDEIDSLCNP
jgi:WD40 repeat protein